MAENRCFRCNKEADEDFHNAKIVVFNADASFSGIFKLPLCYGCSMLPHNLDYERCDLND